MKKVWILEGYVTKEHMEQSMSDIESMIEWAKKHGDEESVKVANEMKDAYAKKVAENPDGYWLGYHGKVNYKCFCEEAKQTLRNPAMKNMKWRVLKAEIADDAKTWDNYVNGIENEGVLRYLYATM